MGFFDKINNFNFDDLSRKLTEVGQEAFNQGTAFAGNAKSYFKTSDIEKQLNGAYTELGKSFYTSAKSAPPAEYADAFAKIAQLETQFEQYKEQSRRERGVTLCPKCGAEVGIGVAFCNMCGNTMPAAEQYKSVVCPGCGANYPQGTMFCANCGTNLQQVQPTVNQMPLGQVNMTGGVISSPGFSQPMPTSQGFTSTPAPTMPPVMAQPTPAPIVPPVTAQPTPTVPPVMAAPALTLNKEPEAAPVTAAPSLTLNKEPEAAPMAAPALTLNKEPEAPKAPVIALEKAPETPQAPVPPMTPPQPPVPPMTPPQPPVPPMTPPQPPVPTMAPPQAPVPPMAPPQAPVPPMAPPQPPVPPMAPPQAPVPPMAPPQPPVPPMAPPQFSGLPKGGPGSMQMDIDTSVSYGDTNKKQ